MSNLEKTLSIVKPDAVERNLTEKIKNIFLKNNLKIKKNKKIHITKDEAAEFYKVHQSKPFYNDLCTYLSSGPIVVMILEGENVVQGVRDLLGPTDSTTAPKGTIRGDLGTDRMRNVAHASDSPENAQVEIERFFSDLFATA